MEVNVQLVELSYIRYICVYFSGYNCSAFFSACATSALPPIVTEQWLNTFQARTALKCIFVLYKHNLCSYLASVASAAATTSSSTAAQQVYCTNC
jgi:hypothetical protein